MLPEVFFVMFFIGIFTLMFYVFYTDNNIKKNRDEYTRGYNDAICDQEEAIKNDLYIKYLVSNLDSDMLASVATRLGKCGKEE